MPTATPFKTLGRGNGFIHSANGYSVDVNNYSVWTTLGGYDSNSTNSVTESQKNLSKQRAMQLYWNLYSVNGDLSAIQQNAFPDFNESLSNAIANKQPKNRICLNADVFGSSPFNKCEISTHNYPLYMYNGSVSNYENFIGFGFGTEPQPFTDPGEYIFIQAKSRVDAQTISEIIVTSVSDTGTLTTLSNYPFVSVATGHTTDELNFTASADSSGTYNDGTPYTKTSSVEIDSLSFYTY